MENEVPDELDNNDFDMNVHDKIFWENHGAAVANCPKCFGMEVREKDKINLLKCHRCEIFFCLYCNSECGHFNGGIENAKLHYEYAPCRYMELK